MRNSQEREQSRCRCISSDKVEKNEGRFIDWEPRLWKSFVVVVAFMGEHEENNNIDKRVAAAAAAYQELLQRIPNQSLINLIGIIPCIAAYNVMLFYFLCTCVLLADV